jgi:hypothetical protein
VLGLLNPSVVVEERTLRLVGLSVSLPVIEMLLLLAGAVVLLILLLDAATPYRRRLAHRRLEEQLADRARQIARVKSGAYDRVPELLESLRELLGTIELYGPCVAE